MELARQPHKLPVPMQADSEGIGSRSQISDEFITVHITAGTKRAAGCWLENHCDRPTSLVLHFIPNIGDRQTV